MELINSVDLINLLSRMFWLIDTYLVAMSAHSALVRGHASDTNI